MTAHITDGPGAALLRSMAKAVVVALAVRGWLSLRVAGSLIRRGGLQHD